MVQRIGTRRIPTDLWKSWKGNLPLIILLGPYSSRVNARVRCATYVSACVHSCVRACVRACVRTGNTDARSRGGPDFKEKGGNRIYYRLVPFDLRRAGLKSRSGFRVNLSVPETDFVGERGVRMPHARGCLFFQLTS